VSQERSQAERELKVCFGTLAEAAAAPKEGFGHFRSEIELGHYPLGP